MRTSRSGSCGFTLIELLVAICLTAALAAAVLPLWMSIEAQQVAETDRIIGLTQARVATARLDRDLRLGTAVDQGAGVSGPVLFAEGDFVTLLTSTGEGGELEIVTWEVAGRRLMRRRAIWGGAAPAAEANISYFDHKSMLEDVSDGTGLTYWRDGTELAAGDGDVGGGGSMPGGLQPDRVALEGDVYPGGGRVGAPLLAVAEVGR